MRFSKFKEFLPGIKKLKILFVGTEAAPFAKAGGLGDVMYSLPLALRELGQDARVFIPRYGTINPEEYNLKNILSGLRVPTDQPEPHPYLICNVKKYEGPKSVPAYFLENMEYYEKRANVYGYSDDPVRWALLCRGVIEFLKRSPWVPDLIVASDWQTGLIPNYLKNQYQGDPVVSDIPVVLAIHNLRHQGMRDFKYVPESERDSGREPVPDFFNGRLGSLNWLLRGIMYSDRIVVVSPTYAKEILTSEYGEGLDKILCEKQHKITGILNGINYKKYNPLTSPEVPVHYTIRSIKKRNENKVHLQKRFGLPEDPNIFVAGIASRFAEQKGFDLLKQIVEPLFKNLPLQLIIVGDGDSRYKEMIQQAKEKFPNHIGYHFGFDVSIPFLIFSGADAMLIPSKFEPCGIVQMQAMRFGCIPIARKTGGLADTVKDFNPKKEKGDGFLFQEYDPWALLVTIVKAHTSFKFPYIWKKIVKRAMRKDFSWEKSARKYLKVFKEIIK